MEITISLQILITFGTILVSIVSSYFIQKGRIDLIESRMKQNEQIAIKIEKISEKLIEIDKKLSIHIAESHNKNE